MGDLWHYPSSSGNLYKCRKRIHLHSPRPKVATSSSHSLSEDIKDSWNLRSPPSSSLSSRHLRSLIPTSMVTGRPCEELLHPNDSNISRSTASFPELHPSWGSDIATTSYDLAFLVENKTGGTILSDLLFQWDSNFVPVCFLRNPRTSKRCAFVSNNHQDLNLAIIVIEPRCNGTPGNQTQARGRASGAPNFQEVGPTPPIHLGWMPDMI
jgi:hypothetical protein